MREFVKLLLLTASSNEIIDGLELLPPIVHFISLLTIFHSRISSYLFSFLDQINFHFPRFELKGKMATPIALIKRGVK